MTNWRRTLDLTPYYGVLMTMPESAEDYDTKLLELAQVVVMRLGAMADFGKPDEKQDARRKELVTEFEILVEQGSFPVDAFNEVMTMLYDWGDTPVQDGQTCWVKQF